MLFTKLVLPCYGRSMSTFQLILFVVLVPLTVFNIYSLTVGRKKRKTADVKYQQILVEIEKQALSIAKREKLPFETQMRFLNDANQGILLAFDKKGELAGVFFDGSYHLFYQKNFLGAQQTWEVVNEKHITNISVKIETTEEVLTVIFGTRTYRPRSYLGKFILKDSNEFCTAINAHLRPSGALREDAALADHTESESPQQ